MEGGYWMVYVQYVDAIKRDRQLTRQVCRKDLKGGLGPRGYGSVIHLEPRKV